MKFRVFLLAGVVLTLTACNRDAIEAQGFSLPEGDIERGRAAFAALECTTCHSVGDIEQDVENPEISIRLGGTERGARTYGMLVTAIINPSHRISRAFPSATTGSQSNMRSYNDVMTVQQLVDLTEFLKSEFDVQSTTKTRYYDYYKDRKPNSQ